MSDLAVVTRAKDLATYLFGVTEKSPKRFRFTLCSRMQNAALDILDGLYAANDTWIDAGDGVARQAALQKRLDLQHGALTSATRLDYMLTLSREQGTILPKQYEHAAGLLYEIRCLLGGWIKSDRR